MKKDVFSDPYVVKDEIVLNDIYEILTDDATEDNFCRNFSSRFISKESERFKEIIKVIKK